MDTDLLETSLALVADDEHALTLRFYEILFDRHPEVRPMFSADIRPQAPRPGRPRSARSPR